MFLTVVYISRKRDGGVTFYYTCEAGGRVGAHKRLLEGRDRDRWTRNARCSRENMREDGEERAGEGRRRREKRAKEKRKKRLKDEKDGG